MCGRCFGCEYRCDCVCGCVGVVLDVNIGVTVFVGVWTLLALNREGRTISNVCALDQYQKQYFTVLLSFIYLYTFTLVMLNCLTVLFLCGN